MNSDREEKEVQGPTMEQPAPGASRRDVLRLGALGLAGFAGAAAVGMQASEAQAKQHRSGKKRVAILADGRVLERLVHGNRIDRRFSARQVEQ